MEANNKFPSTAVDKGWEGLYGSYYGTYLVKRIKSLPAKFNAGRLIMAQVTIFINGWK